jgi:hypothetical protein
MSEFKFACPVCGQHMMCDVSHGGSVMECPTCFQKIVAPQAPAPDAKFILTGTKLTEKKILVPGATALASAPQKSFPVAAVLFLLALLLALGAAGYFFRGKLLGQTYDWKTADVGKIRLPGTFSQQGRKLMVAGSGTDIWFQNDAFRYVYVPLTGDGTITARVLNLQNTDPWAKAGVMFRDSLNDDAKFTLAAVTPGNGITFQIREQPGGQAASVVITPGVVAPQWFRLKRLGDNFTAEASVDGARWTSMGAAKVSMNHRLFVGLAVSSHNESTLCEAQFDQVVIQGNLGAPPAETNSPFANERLLAPPASDTNWLMNLADAAIPETTVVGRIHGQDFILERAAYQNGLLILRQGQRGPVEFGVTINFSGALPSALAGRTIHVQPDATKAARLTLHWKDASGTNQKANFDEKYALRLEFGAIARGRLPGKIYLCTPDAEKSYVLGQFTAAIIRPKPKSQG